MASVPVPGVAITSTRGTIGVQPFAVVHHWRFGTLAQRWVQADLDLLATTCVTSWVTNFGPVAGSNVKVVECEARDLTDNQSLSSLHTTAGTPGTATGVLEPSSLAVMTRLPINSRYRGGHPRTYFPVGTVANLQNENSWQQSWISSLKPIIAQWRNTIQSAAYTQQPNLLALCVPRYTYTISNDEVHKKYVRERTGLLNVYDVGTPDPQVIIGSQRRRLTTG